MLYHFQSFLTIKIQFSSINIILSYCSLFIYFHFLFIILFFHFESSTIANQFLKEIGDLNYLFHQLG